MGERWDMECLHRPSCRNHARARGGRIVDETKTASVSSTKSAGRLSLSGLIPRPCAGRVCDGFGTNLPRSRVHGTCQFRPTTVLLHSEARSRARKILRSSLRGVVIRDRHLSAVPVRGTGMVIYAQHEDSMRRARVRGVWQVGSSWSARAPRIRLYPAQSVASGYATKVVPTTDGVLSRLCMRDCCLLVIYGLLYMPRSKRLASITTGDVPCLSCFPVTIGLVVTQARSNGSLRASPGPHLPARPSVVVTWNHASAVH
ncbi:hypothetical protein LXA43DRAFT_984808 [Ganoderma leucocontextum]|nr:hypothetical protein LXA43DRAFT_984808 [Ganoderma leucocontextum]